ncbi:hypothetical protein RASY3_14645 [Ruminococcus albus SY3]|uniref:Uncharacterized protein n=1 Tax=Ruminococcus albus SY3 TaxID=1341156 RepID=A0A011WNK0_RUMAL|nr:hypothetical protein [Ruminococcus albus]EXM38550.1 hypothetical protein RASY3_14645 [Ruminococcus albus SY3]
MDIKELNERIEQLTNLVKTSEETISQLKETLKSVEQERDRLADERRELEPNLERAEEGEEYWSVGSKFCAEGKATPCHHYENFHRSDNNYFNNNNYFKTVQRAKEVANKINVLLKLERLHDIYCPNYKPNWGEYSLKHYVKYCVSEAKWYPYCIRTMEDVVQIYFPTEEIAQKVCDILNKENGIKTEV